MNAPVIYPLNVFRFHVEFLKMHWVVARMKRCPFVMVPFPNARA